MEEAMDVFSACRAVFEWLAALFGQMLSVRSDMIYGRPFGLREEGEE